MTSMKGEGIERVWLGRRGLLYLSFYLSEFGSLKESQPRWQQQQVLNKQSPEPRIPFPGGLGTAPGGLFTPALQ